MFVDGRRMIAYVSNFDRVPMADEGRPQRPIDVGYVPGDLQMTYQPPLVCYRLMRSAELKFIGREIRYTFISDEDDLYYTKISSKSQKDPLPLFMQRGLEAGPPDFDMHCSADFQSFSVRRNEIELFTATMLLTDGAKSPKRIEADWRYNDGSVMLHFYSQTPSRDSQGNWKLDFSERTAEPSIQNCIMIDSATSDVAIMVRKVDSVETDIDARPNIPTLFLFFLAIALKICPI
jgi:hypothetical protein